MKYKIIRPPLEARFQLPSKEDLFKIASGDHIKLMFQVGTDIVERMWVKVEACYDANEWTGALDNQPVGKENSKGLKPGKKIKFHPYDVIDIITQESARMAELEAIIAASVKERIQQVWWKRPELVITIVLLIIAVISIPWWPTWLSVLPLTIIEQNQTTSSG